MAGGEGINEPFEDVKAFQLAFGYPVGASPRSLSGAEKARRIAWMREELAELADAEAVEDQADAIADLLYFAFGCLVEMGVPPSGVWAAVHRANMAKLWPDGVRRTAVGKVMKPDGWIGPEDEIRRYIEVLRHNSKCADNNAEL